MAVPAEAWQLTAEGKIKRIALPRSQVSNFTSHSPVAEANPGGLRVMLGLRWQRLEARAQNQVGELVQPQDAQRQGLPPTSTHTHTVELHVGREKVLPGLQAGLGGFPQCDQRAAVYPGAAHVPWPWESGARSNVPAWWTDTRGSSVGGEGLGHHSMLLAGPDVPTM